MMLFSKSRWNQNFVNTDSKLEEARADIGISNSLLSGAILFLGAFGGQILVFAFGKEAPVEYKVWLALGFAVVIALGLAGVAFWWRKAALQRLDEVLSQSKIVVQPTLSPPIHITTLSDPLKETTL